MLLPWIVAFFGFPLCVPLANRADSILGGKDIPLPFWIAVRESLLLTITITVVGLSVGIVLFLLSLIPAVGVVFSMFSVFIWTPMMMCLNVYENSLSRRGMNLRAMVRFILKRPITNLLVGFQTTVLISLPIINLLGLPLAIIAGVIAVREIEVRD